MPEAAILPVHRSTIRYAVCGLVLLAAAVGCGEKGKATGDSVVGGSATAATSADTAAGRAAVTPDATWQAGCSLEATPPANVRACRGVTYATFLQTPTIAELKRILEDEGGRNTLKSSKGAHRRMDCPSCSREFVNTWINRDNRNYSLADLPSDRTVVVGALTAPSNSPWNDGYYRIGRGMRGSGGNDTRKILIFATRTTPTNPPTYGSVVAAFHFVTTDGKTVSVSPGGRVIDCADIHTGRNSDTTSAFLGCPDISKVSAIAAQFGISFDDVLDWYGNEKQPPTSFADFVKSLGKSIAMSPAPTMASLQKMYDEIKPDSAPYWFACANGCCTAEMIN